MAAPDVGELQRTCARVSDSRVSACRGHLVSAGAGSWSYDRPVADRYGSDVLADNPHRAKVRSTERPVEIGLVVEDAQTGYVGAVVRIEYGRMELEDRHGRRKPFLVGPGYLIDGRPVILTLRAAPPRTEPAPHRVPSR